MAFFQYLKFDGVDLPLPVSYEVSMSDVEADSGGETEAGTTQRDVIRLGVVNIAVTFQVTQKWLKLLTGFKQQEKISVDYFDTEAADIRARAEKGDLPCACQHQESEYQKRTWYEL